MNEEIKKVINRYGLEVFVAFLISYHVILTSLNDCLDTSLVTSMVICFIAMEQVSHNKVMESKEE